MQDGNDSMQARTQEDASALLDDDDGVRSLANGEAQGSDQRFHVNADDLADPFGLDEIERPRAPSGKQWISVGVFVLTLIAMIATGLVITAADERKTSALAALEARLDESVIGRRERLLVWVESRVRASRRLTESDLVRLFVSDMALSPAGTPLPRAVLDQRPYFQTLISEFADQNGLMRAAVLDQNGRLLLGSSGPSLDVTGILANVDAASTGWTSIVLPVRLVLGQEEDLAIDVLVPLPKVQSTGKMASDDVMIFVQTIRASDVLDSLLTVSPVRRDAESVFLIQERDNALEQISLATSGDASLRLAQSDLTSEQRDFAVLQRSIVEDRLVYAVGGLIPGIRWTVLHVVDARAALAAVDRFILAMIGIAVAIVLGASLCLATLWWRRASVHHHELMLLYQGFADRLDNKRRFLATIMNSMSDWLAVTNQEKRYSYVNPAFAKALGLPTEKILGRSAEDVLSTSRLEPAGDSFDGLAAGEPLDICQIGGRRHLVAASWSDLRDRTGQSMGTVAVMRDQTELVEQRQQRMRALTETIDAFVHIIERRDPFLLGHTRRLRSYAIAVGRKLGLDDDGLTAMALAASLSQVGKIFIPDEILVKPKRHNQQEADVMRRHIDHALGILGRIDFGFPVVEILGQMHERLDGSGYPNGLCDDDIDLPGRILGVVDVFCARTAPRSYRDRLSAGHALFHLANNASRYDVNVISALTGIVKRDGELNLEEFDDDFLDAQVWKKIVRHRDAVDVGDPPDVTPATMAV